jgi:hypothetical protein
LRADDAAQLDKHRSVDAAGKLVERHPPGLDRVQVDPRTSGHRVGRRAAEVLVRNRIAPDPDLFELAAALWSAAVKHVDSRPEVDTEALRGLREAITNDLPTLDPIPIRWLHLTLQGIGFTDVWGLDNVPEDADDFRSHVSLAYSNAAGPAEPIIRRLGTQLVTAAEITVHRAALIDLNRDHHVYEWTDIATANLRTTTTQIRRDQPLGHPRGHRARV